MPNVYFEKIDVFSLVDGVEKLNTYSLSEIMSSDYDIKLIDADTVIVYDNTSVEGEKYIYFTGLGTKVHLNIFGEKITACTILFLKIHKLIIQNLQLIFLKVELI